MLTRLSKVSLTMFLHGRKRLQSRRHLCKVNDQEPAAWAMEKQDLQQMLNSIITVSEV